MRRIVFCLFAGLILFAGLVSQAIAQYNYGFSAAVTPQPVTISQGSATTFIINISSHDTGNQYKLSIAGLPSGVASSVSTRIVGTGETQVELRAAPNATVGPASVLVSITKIVDVGRVAPLTMSFPLAVQPSSSGTQKSGSRVAAWEYKSVTGDSPQDIVIEANGLGDQLWELVSVTQSPNGQQQQWVGFFKRVKQ